MPAASRSTRSASSAASPMYDGARRILADLEVDIDPRTPVAQLSPGQQQMVEIAKGLSHELKLLILDEPTSSLTINEGRHLFRVIRRLAAQGVAIIYVSHRMAEIFEISDRVTVLKDGRVTGVRETAAVTHGELIALMVGRELSFEPDPRRAPPDAAVALEVRDLVGRTGGLGLVLAALRRDRLPRRAARRRPHRGLRGDLRRAADPVGQRPGRRPRAAAATARRTPWRRASPCCPRTARKAACSWTSRSPPTSSPPTSPPTRTAGLLSEAEMRAGQPSTTSTTCASRRRASTARCATCRAATSRRCCSPSGWRASRAS